MGLVREQVFGFMFGATVFADAFIIAFRIPNLLRDLFAEGALSTAFTTVFTKTWTTAGAEEAWRLTRLVLSALTLILGLICLGAILAAPLVVDLLGRGFDQVPGKFALTVTMTRLLFPFILFASLAAAVMGMLNARHVFALPASASTVFNIVSILSGCLLAAWFEPQADWWHPHFTEKAALGWCLGVLIGGVAQLAVQLPALHELGFRYRWQLNFSDPALQRVLLLMVPTVIAGSAVQINVAVTSQFASFLPGDGPVSWLYYAFRLVQLPIGIFGVAIATVTLPAVARQHALQDLSAFGKTVEEALRFGFFLTLPAAVGLAALAEPTIALIYQHGAFSAESTRETALALQAYTVGLVGYSGIKILVPCFYAMQPPRPEPIPGTPWPQACASYVRQVLLFTPSRVSLFGIGLNLILCVLFTLLLPLGHIGLALSTGFIALLNFVQLLSAIEKKIDLGRVEDWIAFFIRVTLATSVCALIANLSTFLVLDRLASTRFGAACSCSSPSVWRVALISA